MAYKSPGAGPRLFAFIKRLQFSFDPFATESTAVREAWRQLTSPTLKPRTPNVKSTSYPRAASRRPWKRSSWTAPSVL